MLGAAAPGPHRRGQSEPEGRLGAPGPLPRRLGPSPRALAEGHGQCQRAGPGARVRTCVTRTRCAPRRCRAKLEPDSVKSERPSRAGQVSGASDRRRRTFPEAKVVAITSMCLTEGSGSSTFSSAGTVSCTGKSHTPTLRSLDRPTDRACSSVTTGHRVPKQSRNCSRTSECRRRAFTGRIHEVPFATAEPYALRPWLAPKSGRIRGSISGVRIDASPELAMPD